MQAQVQNRFDVELYRRDFPTLHQEVYGKPLTYLDNGATTQKPKSVIERIARYYQQENSNVHRGVHFLSQQATTAFEEAREQVRAYLNAERHEEIIFTSGTTAGINLVAQSWGRKNLNAGDEVVITAMEHHANIVPWQMICEEKQAKLVVIPMDNTGTLITENLENYITPKTKMISVVHVSNVLGTVNPVELLIKKAREVGALCLVDGAQAVQHKKVDVTKLDADFYVFSGHKLFGPTGIGVLYGKYDILDSMPPFLGGGDMIKTVTFQKTTYNELPHKFEAGTPNIAAVLGLSEAIKYVEKIGLDAIELWEHEMLNYLTNSLTQFPEIEFIGTAEHKISAVSFNVAGAHPYDVGTLLDKMGVAVRTGHHCGQPIMDFFQIPGTVRASLAFYNTYADVDRLCEALKKVIPLVR
ncbi:MAG: aminotransferase class V-fold PLP-dependent enzyme [Luteibaculaceae bacterium]